MGRKRKPVRQPEPKKVKLHAFADGKSSEVQVTVEKLRSVSVMQNRITLNGQQIEAMLQIEGARWLLGDATGKLIYSGVRRRRPWRYMRMASGLLHRFSEEFMSDHLNLQQILVVDRALTGLGVHLTKVGDKSPDHCLCMDTNAVAVIANAALKQCWIECRCGKAAEAKKCKLRRALNQIPGFQEQCGNGVELYPHAPGVCPYYMVLHPEMLEDETEENTDPEL